MGKSKFTIYTPIFFAMLLMPCFLPPSLHGRTLDADGIHRRAFTSALEALMNEFAEDKKDIEKKTNRALIIGYTQTSNLPQDVQNTMLLRLEETAVVAPNSINLPRCLECLTVQAEIEDGDIYIKRGVTKAEDLERYFIKYNAKAYLSLNLSYVGDKLTMNITIYNNGDRNVIFAKSYEQYLKKIPDEEVLFSLTAGVLSPRDNKIAPLVGGELAIGQYVAGIGNFGLNAASYSNPDKNLISYFGLFSNTNLNDLAGKPWRFGYLSFTINLGFALFKNQTQLHFSPGLKLNAGSIFHLAVRYGMHKKLGTLTPGASPASEATIDQNKNIPSYIALGLGIDL